MTRKIDKSAIAPVCLAVLLLTGLIALNGCGLFAKKDPAPGAVIKNALGMEFAYIPAGNFQMGSDVVPWEQPIHPVTIGKPFYMARLKTTEQYWKKLMADRPLFRNYGDDFPVEAASWDDTAEFIKRMNAANDGYTYRLPTEAEWEFAARAGMTGDKVDDVDNLAWDHENSGDKLHPVGQKKPNAWGLYDTLGDTFEWTADVYHDNYKGAPGDGSAWMDGGDQKKRAARASSVYDQGAHLNPAQRASNETSSVSGFRLVAIPKS